MPFLDSFQQFAMNAGRSTREVAIRYFLFTGAAWLLCYVIFRSRWFHRKIVARFPGRGDYGREIAASLLSTIVFGCVGAATVLLYQAHGTQLYTRIRDQEWNWFGLGSDGGWTWFFLSVVLTIFLHDAYFYWTHRLMHHRRLFPVMHGMHHRSRNPSPFAAYAFSPWEAVVQAGIFPLAACLVPLQFWAFAVFMIWQIGFNVLGHCGYEIFPAWFLRSRMGKFMNTPTHHVLHHQHPRANFGLYFNFWDRLCGTNDPQYELWFAEVTSRGNRQAPAPRVAMREPEVDTPASLAGHYSGAAANSRNSGIAG